MEPCSTLLASHFLRTNICLPEQPERTVHRGPLLLYYITDSEQFPGGEAERETRLLDKIAECAVAGVDYIQLREKTFGPRKLETLAREAIAAIPAGSRCRLLINSRPDVALACAAHGVHLPSSDLLASDVRAIFGRVGQATPIIGVSAHSIEDIASAEAHGADFAVLGPVFEKEGIEHPAGLELLRRACMRANKVAGAPMPVLALGGITLENAHRAMEAGAAGIAGIRLFQENDASRIVAQLRTLSARTN